jgi:tRNA(adenine34) deaminase
VGYQRVFDELYAHGANPTEGGPTPRRIGSVTMHPEHDSWMALALDEARRATDTGDVPIGAVVLGPDGTVLGTGRNEREASGDPTAHAEVLALRAAAAARRDSEHDDGWRLEDCTLVVTLEPCAMCAGAIVLARIPRLVFGAWDPKAGACGSVFDVVREPRLNHWVEVYPGIREEECAEVLTGFFRAHRG